MEYAAKVECLKKARLAKMQSLANSAALTATINNEIVA
jgi:hypothetical protein